MIDIIEDCEEFNISPLVPALDEFEASVRKSLQGIDDSDLNQRLSMEAWIYGELVQILDRHGLRTYGLATGVHKQFSHFVVDVIASESKPKTIRQIRIPLK
ncbi:MAG: hypothetical protein FWC60_04240 [Firmicutes bacterium]|nr:hypothetical protein [Bacillota bacterium]